MKASCGSSAATDRPRPPTSNSRRSAPSGSGRCGMRKGRRCSSSPTRADRRISGAFRPRAEVSRSSSRIFATGACCIPASPADGKTIAFERDFGVWTADVASGNGKVVPIALRGAIASACRRASRADEWLSGNVAVTGRKEDCVHRARRSLRDKRCRRRRCGPRHANAVDRVAARVGARQPSIDVRVQPRRRMARLPL